MGTVGQLWRRARATPRRRVVGEAAATFVLGLALLGIGLVNTSGPPVIDIPNRWVLLLPLTAVCLLMLLKRSHPVAALAAGTLPFVLDVLMGGSIGVLFGYIDLIYSVALWAERTHARRIEALVWALTALGGTLLFVLTGDLRAGALLALVLFALLVTPMWWGRAVRTQADLARLADARSQDLERLAELRQGEIVREERTRMAGDLHDALAGNLAAIGIHSDAALSRPDADRHPADQTALTAIRHASVAASDELRTMVHLLRSGEDQRTSPARLAEVDGVLALAGHHGLRVEAHLPDPWPRLPAGTDHAAYRIVQESLTNAAKHAPGSVVVVDIRGTDDRLELRIDNTLTGAPLVSGGGVGLVSMRERAEALGGSFTAGPAPGGWQVTASLPLAPDEGSSR